MTSELAGLTKGSGLWDSGGITNMPLPDNCRRRSLCLDVESGHCPVAAARYAALSATMME
jgi:hypothetical protein